jgi:hypothetical protein
MEEASGAECWLLVGATYYWLGSAPNGAVPYLAADYLIFFKFFVPMTK